MSALEKITCKELIEFLWAYESGELDQERREIFDRHLAVCAECVAYLDTYRETIKMSRAAWEPDPEEIPEDLVKAILAAKG